MRHPCSRSTFSTHSQSTPSADSIPSFFYFSLGSLTNGPYWLDTSVACIDLRYQMGPSDSLMTHPPTRACVTYAWDRPVISIPCRSVMDSDILVGVVTPAVHPLTKASEYKRCTSAPYSIDAKATARSRPISSLPRVGRLARALDC